MSIWTCKVRAVAACAMIALAGCDEIPLPQSNGAGGAKAVTRASLAQGEVQLAAPEGYCIDPRSMRDRFALLGRCDTLGVQGFFNDKDLAIITASTTSVAEGTADPDAAALAAVPGAELVNTLEGDGLAFVRLRGGPARLDAVSDTFWRTAFVVNDQLVNLSLYAPPGSPALEREGARLLERAVAATRRATAQPEG